MLERSNRREQPLDLVGAEHVGKPLGYPGARQILDHARIPEHMAIEKADRGDVPAQAGRSYLAHPLEMQQEGLDVLGTQLLR